MTSFASEDQAREEARRKTEAMLERIQRAGDEVAVDLTRTLDLPEGCTVSFVLDE